MEARIVTAKEEENVAQFSVIFNCWILNHPKIL